MNGESPGHGWPEDLPEDLKERIRELAYAMWEAGGHQHGRALEYWLEAERRILADRKEDSAQAQDTPSRDAANE